MNTTSTPRAGTTTAAAVVNFVVCGITLAGFLLIVIFIDWLGHLSSTSSGRHVATSFALLFLVAGGVSECC